MNELTLGIDSSLTCTGWAAHTVLPDGRSFGDWARPQMAIAFSSGAMPELLPAYGGGGK